VAEGNAEPESEDYSSGLDEWFVMIQWHAKRTNVVFPENFGSL
jgi:hypothetical protein